MEYDVIINDAAEERIMVITNGSLLHIRISVNESDFITAIEAFDVMQRLVIEYDGDSATESLVFGEDTLSITYSPVE